MGTLGKVTRPEDVVSAIASEAHRRATEARGWLRRQNELQAEEDRLARLAATTRRLAAHLDARATEMLAAGVLSDDDRHLLPRAR